MQSKKVTAFNFEKPSATHFKMPKSKEIATRIHAGTKCEEFATSHLMNRIEISVTRSTSEY